MTDTHDAPFGSLPGPRARRLAVALVILVAACSGDQGPETSGAVDREAFIATYVDLRAAALGSASATLTDQAREEVLTRHGVTEEGLVAFAELHGRDVDFMRDVWNDIESRLDEMRLGEGPR